MTSPAEETRDYYRERDAAGVDAVNSLFERPYLFAIQSLERDLLKLLRDGGLRNLAGRDVLDVGCGTGEWLRRLALYGAHVTRLTGLDLLPDRVAAAGVRSPAATFVAANAEQMPFAAGSFDMVTQFVMFSSVRDGDARRRIAREILRVLRPGAVVVSYDFIWNPLNRHTKGLRKAEYRDIFPGCTLEFRRVTLAPPITHRVARFSTILCAMAEKFVFLRSHYLVLVHKP